MTTELPPLGAAQRQAALQGLIVNRSATPDVLCRLSGLTGAAQEIAWSNPQVDSEVADTMLRLGDRDVDAALAMNEHLPQAVLRRLARHPDPEVRSGVPRNGLAADLSELLAADGDARVRAAVARHEAPASIRDLPVADPDPGVRAALATQVAVLPPRTVRLLLADEDPSVRAAACRPRCPAPPQDLHERLPADPATRALTVAHVGLSAALAVELAGDPDSEVRAVLVGHPGLPEESRDLLEADRDGLVRCRLLFSRRLSHERRAALLGGDRSGCGGGRRGGGDRRARHRAVAALGRTTVAPGSAGGRVPSAPGVPAPRSCAGPWRR
ncbi:hypothetical protein ACIQU4_18765 [Streptomyces sp. NPDC090741]|uniref:hypothetical protein n=1 Tax=Streptomyces sp. NPDC090741 TaxID=3365967 RepID=UPI00380A2224